MINSLQQLSDSYALMKATIAHGIDLKMNIQLSGAFTSNGFSFTSLEIAASIITILIFFGSFIIYYTLYPRYWDKGIFPPLLKNRSINHFEAIVCLSVNIMRCNKDEYGEKRGVLVTYVQRYFPEHANGVSDSIKIALQTPISTQSITSWMNKHIQTSAEKLKILELLFAIATVDGHVLKNEINIIKQFCIQMELPMEEFTRRWEAFVRLKTAQEKNKRSQSEKVKVYSVNSMKLKHLELFNLTETSSKEMIKKRYRELAKENHPDMFMDADLEVKRAISDRFIQIQEAYDYLMELL